MKSNGITTSKIIEIDFKGLNSRFELFTPPPLQKNRGPNYHEFIKMQCDISNHARELKLPGYTA